MNSRRIIIFSLLLMMGCEGWGSTIVESDGFVPQLSILATMTPDEGGQTLVKVLRTLPLEGPEMSKETYTDTTYYSYFDYDQNIYIDGFHLDTQYKSNYEVWDAVVILSDGNWIDTLIYADVNDSSTSWGGISDHYYVPTDPAFVPVAGRTYTLDIQTPDGLQATGQTTIPLLNIEFYNPPLDTLSIPGDIRIRWSGSTGNYRILTERVDGNLCVSFTDRIYDLAITDTSYTLRFEDCGGGRFPDSPDQPIDTDWAIEEITIMAIDENYFDFYYGAGSRNDLDFFFLGQGTRGYSAGIDGGLGVFGSYRLRSIKVYLRE